jgi:DNA-directed RNA polymerase sigma subunit (sigma70/sigma32)
MSCKHYKHILRKEDRHFVDSAQHNNCVICLVDDKGKMTQEEVGNYLGLTKMRISQIERQALEKFKRRAARFLQ